MSDTWLQEQNRQRIRRKQKNQANLQGAPFLGMISGSHDSENEVVVVQYPGGERKLRTLQPYVGTDSWIRVGAEAGVPVILSQRPDSNEPEILCYAQRQDSSSDRINRYNNEAPSLYRPLTPGEIEVHSTGLAQTYWSRRPLLEQRGGLIRQWLDQDNLESGVKAPVHIRLLHLNRSDEVGDEEKIGVVQRPDGLYKKRYIRAARPPDPALTAQFTAAAAAAGVIAVPGPWAKEHLRVIKSGALYPKVLLDVREGDVMDDAGVPVNLGLSGLPMRYKGEWFCDSPLGGEVFVGVDNQGNCAIALPNEATVGLDFKIPMGDFTVTIGKNYSTSVQIDYSLATLTGSMTLDCFKDYSLTTKTGGMKLEAATDYQLETKAGDVHCKSPTAFTAVAPQVNLGEDLPFEKAILGTTFRLNELTMNNQLVAQLQVLAGMIAAAGASLITASTDAVFAALCSTAAPAVGAAGGTLTSMASPFAAMGAAIQAFETQAGANQDYQSITVKLKR